MASGSIRIRGASFDTVCSSDPSEWLRFFWTDLHSGWKHRIESRGNSNLDAIRIQTFEDILDCFRDHPEVKSADSLGNPSSQGTVGLLGRLHVHTLTITHIAEETNLLEQQEEGILLTDPQMVYSGGSEWETVRPYFNRVSISELANRTGIPARTLRSYRLGDRKPRAKNCQAITAALAEMLDEGEVVELAG